MRRRVPVLLALLAACTDDPKDGADTDVVVDTEVIVETGTIPADTDMVPADSEPPDTDVPIDDPPVDTSTPLADAVDGAFVGAWAPRGGSRLVAVHVLHEGATEPVFSHFHDTLLDLDCRFVLAEDERLRCLPSGEPRVWMTPADDHTTLGAAIDATCTTSGRHLVEGAGVLTPTCRLAGASVTELVPDPTVEDVAYQDSTGTWFSFPLSAWGSPISVFAGIGAHLAPERFVRGYPQHVPTGGDLHVIVVRGADGAVEPVGFYDPVRDVPCSPVHFADEADDTLRCAPIMDVIDLPFRGFPERGYSDASCTTLSIVEAPACDSPLPNTGLDPVRPAWRAVLDLTVREVTSIRALGAATSTAFRYRGATSAYNDPTCDPGGWTEPMRQLLAAIPPDTLPRLSRAGVGEGDVRAYAWTDGDGRPLRPVDRLPFVDADDVPCTPDWEEGAASVRCAPFLEGAIRVSGLVSGSDCRTGQILNPTWGGRPGTVSLPDPLAGGGCFGASRAARNVQPRTTGERLPAHTYLYGWEGGGLSGGPICYAADWIDEDDEIYELIDDERPLSAWPRLTLDR